MANPIGGPDYYEILGIASSATPEQIAGAFRGLARQWHPDVCPEAREAAENFKLIAEAYEVLGDPERRRQYDRALLRSHAPPGSRPPRGDHPARAGARPRSDELLKRFRWMLDPFPPRPTGSPGPAIPGTGSFTPGVDIEAELSLTLEEAHRGGSITFWLSFQEQCPDCQHRGGASGCRTCSGSGEIRREPRPLTVHVPPGLWTGSVVRVAGAGKSLRGGPPGDLVLRIRVRLR